MFATDGVFAPSTLKVLSYQKFGFKEAGRRKRYYEDTGEDALVMWRNGIEKPEFLQYLAVEKVQMCDRLHQKKWHLAIDGFEF